MACLPPWSTILMRLAIAKGKANMVYHPSRLLPDALLPWNVIREVSRHRCLQPDSVSKRFRATPWWKAPRGGAAALRRRKQPSPRPRRRWLRPSPRPPRPTAQSSTPARYVLVLMLSPACVACDWCPGFHALRAPLSPWTSPPAGKEAVGSSCAQLLNPGTCQQMHCAYVLNHMRRDMGWRFEIQETGLGPITASLSAAAAHSGCFQLYY